VGLKPDGATSDGNEHHDRARVDPTTSTTTVSLVPGTTGGLLLIGHAASDCIRWKRYLQALVDCSGALADNFDSDNGSQMQGNEETVAQEEGS